MQKIECCSPDRLKNRYFQKPEIFGHNQQKRLLLKSFWNDYSKYYSMLGLSPVFQCFVSDTINRACVTQDQHVLDIGCGPGYFILPVIKRGGSVTAVDYSEEMLAKAKRTLSTTASAQPNSKVKFVSDDAFLYLQKVSSASFDTVIASLFLSYSQEYEALLSQIFRVLKPGGRFVMSNPVPAPRFTKVFWKSGWSTLFHLFTAIKLLVYSNKIKCFEKKGIFHFFDYSETQNLLLRTGFKAESLDITLSFAETVFLSSAIKPLL